MATYIIGDVHGCWRTLEGLLSTIRFEPGSDRAILVGDLVNKGPASLEVLRWAASHSGAVDTVLGNHDIHLLAAASGVGRTLEKDTFSDVLEASDGKSLVEWLRKRPVMIEIDGHTIVHAGVHPTWDVETARSHARELEKAIREENPAILKKKQAPGTLQEAIDEEQRLRFRLAVFTRMRAVSEGGDLLHGFSGPPESIPSGNVPWFTAIDSSWRDQPLIFGHWAALGFHRGENTVCIDTGCVWGNALMAIRLEDGQRWHQKSRER